jgi:hypothetical protein
VGRFVEKRETDFGVWVILVKSPISALAEKSDSGNPASKK